MRFLRRAPDPGVPDEIVAVVPLDEPEVLEQPRLPPPVVSPLRVIRWQSLAVALAIAVGLWFVLQLFAGVLAPFVTAAVIAYALDPPTTRLTRLGLPRGLAALAMVLAMLAAVLLFLLLLYPLILSQIGLFLGRIPQYAQLLQHWASHVVQDLQQNFGSETVNGRLQDLISSQAGNMLTFLASALTGVISGSFAIFNVLTLAVVTPVVAFYLLRGWPDMVGKIDAWLPRRYAAVIREQAREVDRILSAWVRGQAMCCVLLAVFYAFALSIAGLDLGLIVGLAAGVLSFIPYVGSITGGITAIALALAQFPTWRGVVGNRRGARARPDSGELPDLSPLSWRSRGTARGLGDFRAVCRGCGIRVHGGHACGPRRRHVWGLVSVLAPAVSAQPPLSGLMCWHERS